MNPPEAAPSLTEVVPRALEGERVDRAVALVTGLTRAEVAGLVDAGSVRIGGRVVSSRGRRVHEGERLDVVLPAATPTPAALEGDPSVAVSVVYADADLVVIDKPAGLVVHPGAGHRAGTLVQGLIDRYPEMAALAEPGAEARPGIVHRLDKGTSGLLVVARTAAARTALSAALAARDVRRVYAALVVGTLDSDEGVIDAPLGRGGRDPTRVTVHAAGRPARTAYRVEARYDHPVALTLLECRLETGRTHQIRVHLEAIGHPVVGDQRYGAHRAVDLDGWAPLPGDRPWLHARELAFDHPRTGEPLHFSSPLPPDLVAVLDALS